MSRQERSGSQNTGSRNLKLSRAVSNFETNLFPIILDPVASKRICKFDFVVQQDQFDETFDHKPFTNVIIQDFLLMNPGLLKSSFNTYTPGDAFFYATVDFALQPDCVTQFDVDCKQSHRRFNVTLQKDDDFSPAILKKDHQVVNKLLESSLRRHFECLEQDELIFYEKEAPNSKSQTHGFSIHIAKQAEQFVLMVNIRKLNNKYTTNQDQNQGDSYYTSSVFHYSNFVAAIMSKCSDFIGVGFKLDTRPIAWQFNKFDVPFRYGFVYRSTEIKWAFFSIDPTVSNEQMEEFADKLMAYGESMNMYFNPPLIVRSINCDKKHLVYNFLYNVNNRISNIDLLVIGTSKAQEDQSHIYETLKAISESEFGIVTQCFSFEKFLTAPESYFFNILWKMNSKTNGLGARFPMDRFIFDHSKVLVLGCHSGDTMMSIVSNFGDHFQQVFSSCSLLSDTDQFAKHIKNACDKLPDQLEYVIVYASEKDAASLQELLMKSVYLQSFDFKWTIIQVSLNPKIRFFSNPSNNQGAAKNVKFHAGTLVPSKLDDQVFYLSSVDRGNSSSLTEYKIVFNDFNDFRRNNILEQLTFALCSHSARLPYGHPYPSVMDYALRIYERHDIYQVYSTKQQLSEPQINPNICAQFFFC